MMMQNLIQSIEAYCDRHNMPITSFGRIFMRDPSFVFDLRNGRECLPSTIAKLEAAMQSPPPLEKTGAAEP